jgi:hypothetical protein
MLDAHTKALRLREASMHAHTWVFKCKRICASHFRPEKCKRRHAWPLLNFSPMSEIVPHSSN